MGPDHLKPCACNLHLLEVATCCVQCFLDKIAVVFLGGMDCEALAAVSHGLVELVSSASFNDTTNWYIVSIPDSFKTCPQHTTLNTAHPLRLT